MRITVRKAPAWFTLVPPVQFQPESLMVLRPGFSGAPAGEHRIDLELEVLNLHLGPAET